MTEPREKVQIMGEYGATPTNIAVSEDGAIKTDIEVDVSSGLNVFISGAAVTVSGQPVTVSGDHVYVESGVYLASGIHVVADVTVDSGLGVLISGQHVYVESGAHVVAAISVDSGLNVVVESGLGVQVESGAYIASGLHVVADIAESGLGVQIQSGAGVIVQSGLQAVVASGLNVQVGSGVYLASGVHFVTEMEVRVDISGDAVTVSGQPVTVSSGRVSILSGEVVSKISGQPVMITDRSGHITDLYDDNSLKTAPAKTDIEGWESTAGINTSPDITGLTLSTNHRGKGRYSVEFDKTGVTQAYAMISRPIPSKNIRDYSTHAWLLYHLYLADLSDVTVVYTALGTAAGNLWYWQTDVGELNAGWNHIMHSMMYVDGSLGTGCRLEDVQFIAVYVGFSAAGDTLNNIRVDDCVVKRATELGQYRFNVTSGQVSVSSGEVHVMSGSIIVESGNITVDSGLHVVVESGLGVLISGQHVYVESGLNVVVESGLHVLISGQHVHLESGDNIDTYAYGYYHASGDWRQLAVDASGQLDLAVEVSSGLHVNISGTPVTISGDHVFVESGVYLASGLYAASGVGVLIQSGAGVQIQSGEGVVVQSGIYIASGIFVVADVAVEVSSGLHVVISGQPVTISGDHVFVESGVYLASGVGVLIQSGAGVQIQSGAGVLIQSGAGVLVDATSTSGQMVHIGCADTIRTGNLQPVTTNSGGASLCASGWVCSGPIHSIIIKSISGNCPIYIGGVSCKPYSGHGLVLDGQEAINLDVCSPCDVWACGICDSGNALSWIGTDY